MSFYKSPMAVLALVSGLLFAPLNEALANNDLDGVWRGELEIQNGISLTIGLTIQNGELTLDSPNQGMFGKAPTEYEVTANSVSFSDADLSATFTAMVKDGALDGTFTQGKARPLVLEKLTESDLERIVFSHAYTGDLVINRRNSLPLWFKMAVFAGRYLSTQESPAQEKIGRATTSDRR